MENKLEKEMEKNIIIIRSIKDYVDSDITDNQFKDSVIVYCRVSTISQIEGSSLDTQQQNGIKFYQNSKIEFNNIIVFREEGKSGDDYDSNLTTIRDLLSVILSKIENSFVKHFWVFDSSRLSRSTELSTIILKTLSQNDCNYYINTTKQNFDELENGLMLKILTVFDEYENHKRFQKSVLGKIENMKKGRWNGGNYPFGYKKGDYNGHIIIDRKQSKYVRNIFQLFNKETSIKNILIYLQNENVLPPKSDKSVWNEQTLRNLLRSKKYIGEHIVVSKTDKHLSKIECIEKEKVVTSKIQFPKIINEKLFNEVQIKMEMLQSLSNSNPKVKYDYLLNEVVYCGYCGNKMKINNNHKKNWKVYYCNYKGKSWKYLDDRYPKCGLGNSKSINIDVVEELVWNEVLDTFKNSNIIKEQFKNSVLPNRLEDREQPLNQIKSYNKTISNYRIKIKQLENNLIELYERKLILKIDEKRYNRIKRSINKEIEDFNQKIVEKENDIKQTKNGIVWYDWLVDFDNHYNTIKQYDSLEDKRNFINQIVKKVTVFWDSITNTHTLKITFHIKIVKDKRINKEKYVFKILNGKNVSVINDIHSTKLSKVINKKKKLKVGYNTTQQ